MIESHVKDATYEIFLNLPIYYSPKATATATPTNYLLPAMIGPPMNLGSKGISEVVEGPIFKVGVLRAASSANKDSGLLSKSELVLEAACCSAPASLVTLLVEDGGEGNVVTKAVVDTMALWVPK